MPCHAYNSSYVAFVLVCKATGHALPVEKLMLAVGNLHNKSLSRQRVKCKALVALEAGFTCIIGFCCYALAQ